MLDLAAVALLSVREHPAQLALFRLLLLLLLLLLLQLKLVDPMEQAVFDVELSLAGVDWGLIKMTRAHEFVAARNGLLLLDLTLLLP